jgi:diguanylate cyclase (GGDEF)-like protein
MAAQLAALRAIIDDMNVGIVLLDAECRVQFVNRAFRRFWRISDTLAESKPRFVALLYEGRGHTASTASHFILSEYIAKKIDLIQTGQERPLHIRLSNGEVLQFRCKALANGGRLLTYGNVSELAHRADAMERLAFIDGMTGVNNRRHFHTLADSEWSRHKRYARPLAVLMIDIDRFKAVNDTYGHDAGDEVIKAVAGVLQRNKRAHDILGRLGGEEFALLLIEANVDNAAAAAERLRRLVADCVITVHKRRIPVTVSIGLSVRRAEAGGLDELLKQADMALYEAKRTGRNRVCRFVPGQAPASPPTQPP